MPLQTSGAISLSDIRTEFGGAAPDSLSEYYAGGTYVPAGTSGTNGAVPSSGAIDLSDFYGTSSIKGIKYGDFNVNAGILDVISYDHNIQGITEGDAFFPHNTSPWNVRVAGWFTMQNNNNQAFSFRLILDGLAYSPANWTSPPANSPFTGEVTLVHPNIPGGKHVFPADSQDTYAQAQGSFQPAANNREILVWNSPFAFISGTSPTLTLSGMEIWIEEK